MNVANLLARIGFSVDKKPLEGIKEELEGIKGRLEILGAAELASKIFEAAEKWGHFAEQLGIAATAAGITVEELQKLQYSAGLAGVGAEEVSTGMGHLTRALSEARGGSQEALAAFAALGINQSQLMSFKTSQDALAAFSDGMSHVTDTVQRQDLAFKILGRGAVNMVEWVSQGSAAIKQQGSEAERLAAIIDGKDIEALRGMEDAMSSMFTTFRAFAASTMAVLAPIIKFISQEFQVTFASSMHNTRETMQAWGLRLAYIVGYAIGLFESGIAWVIKFSRAHPKLTKVVLELGAAFFALAIVLTGVGLLGTAFSIVLDLMGAGFKAIRLPIKGMWSALGLVKDIMAWLLLGMGRMIGFLFPQLGAWITRIGLKLLFSPLGAVLLKIAAIAAAVFLVGVAFKTAWDLAHGKNFEDTWMGQLQKKSGNIYEGIKDFLGFGDDEKLMKMYGGGEGGGETPENMLDWARQADDGQAYMIDMSGKGPLPPSRAERQGAHDWAMSKVFNLHNTWNINAGPGSDPKMLGKAIAEEASKKWGTLMNQTDQSNNKGDVAY